MRIRDVRQGPDELLNVAGGSPGTVASCGSSRRRRQYQRLTRPGRPARRHDSLGVHDSLPDTFSGQGHIAAARRARPFTIHCLTPSVALIVLGGATAMNRMICFVLLVTS